MYSSMPPMLSILAVFCSSSAVKKKKNISYDTSGLVLKKKLLWTV
jgi:hypothetical protein